MPHLQIELVQGDITELAVDAIVTAANESLMGGGGVDGAVHRAAGPGLLEECRTIGTCPAGEARISGGYLLKARHVIHAVGPVWDGGDHGEAETLKACYQNSLGLAFNERLQTVAFPCIATGVYAFPKQQACEIAISAVTQWLRLWLFPDKVTFCCFDNENYQIYKQHLQAFE